MTHDFRESPGNGREFSRPVGQFVGPAEPGGLVRLPLGRHPKAERVRRGSWRWRPHRVKEFSTQNTADAESSQNRKQRCTLFFAEPAVQNGLVRVNAAIAQERPVTPS